MKYKAKNGPTYLTQTKVQSVVPHRYPHNHNLHGLKQSNLEDINVFEEQRYIYINRCFKCSRV